MSMLPGDLTCKELVELVTAYVEGALPPSERERFEQHAVRCQGCGAYLAQMRATIELTGKLVETDIPGYAVDALLHAFRGWRSSVAEA